MNGKSALCVDKMCGDDNSFKLLTSSLFLCLICVAFIEIKNRNRIDNGLVADLKCLSKINPLCLTAELLLLSKASCLICIYDDMLLTCVKLQKPLIKPTRFQLFWQKDSHQDDRALCIMCNMTYTDKNILNCEGSNRCWTNNNIVITINKIS